MAVRSLRATGAEAVPEAPAVAPSDNHRCGKKRKRKSKRHGEQTAVAARLKKMCEEEPLVRPKQGTSDLECKQYFSEMDDRRIEAVGDEDAERMQELLDNGKEMPKRPGKGYLAYYDHYFRSETLYSLLGREAALAFLCLEQEGKGNRWCKKSWVERYANLPSSEASVSRASASPDDGAGGLHADPLFFTSALGVGEVLPERLRALKEGGINQGKLRFLCQVAGLVICGAQKWRKLALSKPLPGSPRYVHEVHGVPDAAAVIEEAPENDGVEGAVDPEPLPGVPGPVAPTSYQDVTGVEGRDERHRVGLWALTAENAGSATDLRPGSKNHLISQLQVAHVTFNGREIPILVGRETRIFESAYLNRQNDGSTPFLVRIIDGSKPLAKHIMHGCHNRMGCAMGKSTYSDAILREGFWWAGITAAAAKFREECSGCTIHQTAMRAQTDAVRVPGADYTVRQTLSANPMTCVIIDETGPVKFSNGEGAHGLMVVELVTGRVMLLGIPSTRTVHLVEALGRLQALRGGIDTIVFDAAPSHRLIANSSTITSSGAFLRKKLNQKKIRTKLNDMGIRIKVAPAGAHHQAGHAECVSKNMKIYSFNVFHGMTVRDGLHFQTLLDIMSGVFNNRTRMIDHEGGIHTANTFLQAAARVSTTDVQDLSKLVNTDNFTIKYEVGQIADETRRLLVIFACQYIHRLLAWQVTKFGKDPVIKVGDAVLVADKILLHHYKTARRAIGRVVQVSRTGQAFRVKMATKGQGDFRPDTVKHKKHLVLLARHDPKQEDPIPIDPMADTQVDELMTKDRLSLDAEFFNAGLDKLPCFEQAEEAVEEFEDPEDLAVQADLGKPMTAMDLIFPTGNVIRDVMVRPDLPKKVEGQTGGDEVLGEPVTTRTGRRTKKPDFYQA
jgi:hypothetical protein